MSQYPAVGIGILNWNGKKYLEQFLAPLYNITYPNYTIYVIDNSSSDDSLAYLRANHPTVKIISTGGNLGFAGGYNYGFAQMQEEYLLMINCDVEVPPDFLEPMVALMAADKFVAVCQPKILSWHNKTQFEHAGAAGGMMDYLGYAFCRGRIFDTVEQDENQYKTGDIFWASGACCLIRKEAYVTVGGMYEYFFMHFEEIDLCWRLQAINYSVKYCDESQVYHVGGGSLPYQSPQKTYYNFRNNIVMCLRNSPVLFLLWWLPFRFCIDHIASIRFLVQGDFKNAWSVERAYFALLGWMFAANKKTPFQKRSLMQFPIVIKQSVIWQYFIKKRTKWVSLKS